jgi:hypothetical protein
MKDGEWGTGEKREWGRYPPSEADAIAGVGSSFLHVINR